MRSGHLRMNQPWYSGHMAGAHGPAGHPGMMHGHHPHHQHRHNGFCHSCCHPASQCICHRECRKEAKELLATPKVEREIEDDRAIEILMAMETPEFVGIKTRSIEKEDEISELETDPLSAVAKLPGTKSLARGRAMAYIGGGCCVHLSVEYTFIGTESAVAVGVIDSEGTMLIWANRGVSQPGY